MKIRRLPEIDLARIAPLPGPQKLTALRRQDAGRPPYSYQPARHAAPDAMDAKPALMPDAPGTSWEAIEARIKRETRGGPGEAANLAVTKSLYSFVRREGFEAVQMDLMRCSIGEGESVAYWSNVVLIRGGDIFIPFIDHRRGSGLATTESRLFVASVMHEHLRAQNPDLSTAKLGIIQFASSPSKTERPARMWVDPGSELLPFETLDQLVIETYRMWADVLAERVEAARRTGTDGTGFWG